MKRRIQAVAAISLTYYTSTSVASRSSNSPLTPQRVSSSSCTVCFTSPALPTQSAHPSRSQRPLNQRFSFTERQNHDFNSVKNYRRRHHHHDTQGFSLYARKRRMEMTENSPTNQIVNSFSTSYSPFQRKKTSHSISTTTSALKHNSSQSLTNIQSNNKDNDPMNMGETSILALTMSVLVVLSLAMSNNMNTAGATIELTEGLTELLTDEPSTTIQERIIEIGGNIPSKEVVDTSVVRGLENLSVNLFDAAVPTTAVDALSVAFGEGVAGAIGVFATWIFGNVMMLRSQSNRLMDRFYKRPSTSTTTGGEERSDQDTNEKEDGMMDEFLTETITTSDYFLTRAAALPLLEATGLPPIASTLVSVILASFPSQIIKFNAKLREERKQEEELLNQLLSEEQLLQKRRKNIFFSGRFMGDAGGNGDGTSSQSPLISTADDITTTNMESTSSNAPGTANKIDLVEFFADITKWLEYDVLSTDLGGTIFPSNSGMESAAFGFLAALSSQLYADVIYRNSNYGLEANNLASRNRTLNGWIRLYSTKCFSAAVLFGVYESVRLPISTFISSLLSGGYDGCLGSSDFNLCLETYNIDNPGGRETAAMNFIPSLTDAVGGQGPSGDAQFRAFSVAFVNLVERINFDLSNENVDVTELGRSLFVQLYSLL